MPGRLCQLQHFELNELSASPASFEYEIERKHFFSLREEVQSIDGPRVGLNV